MELKDVLLAGENSGKVKVISLIFECVWTKMGMTTYLSVS